MCVSIHGLLCMHIFLKIRTGHGTTDWFKIDEGVPQGCILSPCLFNLYAEYIMRNSGLEETQGVHKTPIIIPVNKF